MKDAVEAGEVELVHGQVETPHVQPFCVLLLEPRVVMVGEVVDADHVVAARAERFGEQRAYEPAAPVTTYSHDGLA